MRAIVKISLTLYTFFAIDIFYNQKQDRDKPSIESQLKKIKKNILSIYQRKTLYSIVINLYKMSKMLAVHI